MSYKIIMLLSLLLVSCSGIKGYYKPCRQMCSDSDATLTGIEYKDKTITCLCKRRNSGI